MERLNECGSELLRVVRVYTDCRAHGDPLPSLEDVYERLGSLALSLERHRRGVLCVHGELPAFLLLRAFFLYAPSVSPSGFRRTLAGLSLRASYRLVGGRTHGKGVQVCLPTGHVGHRTVPMALGFGLDVPVEGGV